MGEPSRTYAVHQIRTFGHELHSALNVTLGKRREGSLAAGSLGGATPGACREHVRWGECAFMGGLTQT